jgi:hypothetical protein
MKPALVVLHSPALSASLGNHPVGNSNEFIFQWGAVSLACVKLSHRGLIETLTITGEFSFKKGQGLD